MIKYHGTPISGNNVDAVRFFTNHNRAALVSFENPNSLPLVADLCTQFILDNGAFSHWKAGKGDIDVHKYIEWVLKWSNHPGFEWCLIPDKIDGTEEQNLELVQQWLRIAPNAKGVPVWHMHESLDYLNWLVKNFEIVALGSSGDYKTPNTKEWWARMAIAMNTACDEDGKPYCKLHGLRMLNWRVFTKLPFSSADSTNAGVNAGSLSRFGNYLPPTAAQRAEVIAERIESHNSAAIWKE